MPIQEIKPNIFYTGTIDWDRRLFDELIPLPQGTSYNSYIIKGSEKTTLIDSTDPSKENELIENLKKLGIEKIDYIVAHHGEQDHSGAIPKVLQVYPMAKVVTNQKCKDLFKILLLIPEDKFITVKDRETLSLGNKTLEFIFAPWVHWPETMITYLKEDSILFSCDFFGSHFASSELYVNDEPKVYETSKRYFAEIMMPFRPNIKTNLEKIKDLKIEIIAPSHGQVHKKPSFIIDAYKDWVSDEVKNEVVIPYVSMHGSTQKMVDFFVNALIEKGIVAKPFNLSKTDIGELAMSLVDAATIVIGSPTVLAGPHPLAAYAALLANALRPKTRFVSLLGSYGWGGKMAEVLTSLIPNLKVEVLNPVIIKGYPVQENFAELIRLAEDISTKHKGSNLK